MQNLVKVTGRMKAKDIRKGRILFLSGIGGVEMVEVLSKPYKRHGTMWFDVTYPEWDWAVETGYCTSRSLADSGITCLGGYHNDCNRIFRKRKQAENWQVYLTVSGLLRRHEEDMEEFPDPWEDDIEYDPELDEMTSLEDNPLHEGDAR